MSLIDEEYLYINTDYTENTYESLSKPKPLGFSNETYIFETEINHIFEIKIIFFYNRKLNGITRIVQYNEIGNVDFWVCNGKFIINNRRSINIMSIQEKNPFYKLNYADKVIDSLCEKVIKKDYYVIHCDGNYIVAHLKVGLVSVIDIITEKIILTREVFKFFSIILHDFYYFEYDAQQPYEINLKKYNLLNREEKSVTISPCRRTVNLITGRRIFVIEKCEKLYIHVFDTDLNYQLTIQLNIYFDVEHYNSIDNVLLFSNKKTLYSLDISIFDKLISKRYITNKLNNDSKRIINGTGYLKNYLNIPEIVIVGLEVSNDEVICLVDPRREYKYKYLWSVSFKLPTFRKRGDSNNCFIQHKHKNIIFCLLLIYKYHNCDWSKLPLDILWLVIDMTLRE